MMRCKLPLALVLVLTLLSACANRNQIYDWGSYDSLLYQQYKEAGKAMEMRAKLEAHIVQLERNKQKVPPGVYAEVGTLYMQSDDIAKSIDYYRREQTAWPESAGMMNAMITTLNRRQVVKEDAVIAPANIKGEEK